MGNLEERKKYVQRKREDSKINPEFSIGQGQGGNKMGLNMGKDQRGGGIPGQNPSGRPGMPGMNGRPGMPGQRSGMPGQRPGVGGGMPGMNRPGMGGRPGMPGMNRPGMPGMNRPGMPGQNPGERPGAGGGMPGMNRPGMPGRNHLNGRPDNNGINNSFNSTNNNNNNPNNPNGNNNNQQALSNDEKFQQALGKGSTSVWKFFKQFAGSIKKTNILEIKGVLDRLFTVSIVLGVITVLLGIFKHNLFQYSLGSGLLIPIAIGGSKLLQKTPKYKQAKANQQAEQADTKEKEEDGLNNSFKKGLSSNNKEQVEDEPKNPINKTKQKALNIFSDPPKKKEEDKVEKSEKPKNKKVQPPKKEDNNNNFGKNIFKGISNVPTKKKTIDTNNPEESLKKLDEIDPTMVSRQFKLERMEEAGELITPDYKKKTKINEKSDKFNTMDTIFSDIFSVLGFEDDDIDNIDKYVDSLLVDYVYIERPKKKINLGDFDRELTQILRKGYEGLQGNSKKYSKSEFIGRKMITRIFKGVTPMVSVTDVLKNNHDFYLNPEIKMPFILGINDEGKEVKMDLEQVESMLIPGKPRSGKSYTVRQILTQILYFNSSKQVNFYIGDVKGSASDYYRMTAPQIKEFESDDLKILDMLNNLVTKERAKREKKLQDAGVIKISDYHDKYPERSDMPYIYVIIDEMVGLATQLKDRMNASKDAPKYRDQYFNDLNQLVTQLPAYGIRLIAVPHRVTNDFIPKTASDNMMFKIAVAADEELLKETLNISKKKFGYEATSRGDLSVKTSIVSPEPFYCRSLVPASTTTKSDRMFEFQAQFWDKIEQTQSKTKNASENKENKDNTKEEMDIF